MFATRRVKGNGSHNTIIDDNDLRNDNDDDHGDDKADYYDDNLDVSDDRLQQRSQTATCKMHANPASAQRSQAATAAID